ncbi:hypothetical protein E2C01_000687 [Portunus trituberculatus]|uniref:Uncharacterized protein n=1 Tax=Portunus trituberculatus TaxID=210409 RepID=A0A5B7CES3_PORTR|nr:hypothetical protein [Portunus trituberculatus]
MNMETRHGTEGRLNIFTADSFKVDHNLKQAY